MGVAFFGERRGLMANNENPDEPNNNSVKQNSQNNTTPAKRKKWSRKKKIIAILGAIVALIIVIVTVANAATNAPLKVSNEFVSDIKAGDASLAYSMLSEEAKAVTPEDEFNSLVNRISPILSGKPKVISKEVSTPWAATAKVVSEIAGSDGITYALIVDLIKENGQWKILNFESLRK